MVCVNLASKAACGVYTFRNAEQGKKRNIVSSFCISLMGKMMLAFQPSSCFQYL